MSKKLFHCTVSFHGIGEATINNLTQEQAWQLGDVLRLIERRPPNYAANGCLLYSITTELADKRLATTRSSGFLARLMRRFDTWMAPLILLVGFLPALVTAQDRKPQPLKPIRVAVTTQGEAPHQEELDKLLRGELQKRRDVVVAPHGVKYALHLAVAQITIDDKPVGYTAAILVSERGGEDSLSIFIDKDLPALACKLAAYLNQEYLKPAKNYGDNHKTTNRQ